MIEQILERFFGIEATLTLRQQDTVTIRDNQFSSPARRYDGDEIIGWIEDQPIYRV